MPGAPFRKTRLSRQPIEIHRLERPFGIVGDDVDGKVFMPVEDGGSLERLPSDAIRVDGLGERRWREGKRQERGKRHPEPMR